MEKIIFDVDTGHDDAIAIAMAAGLKDEIEIEFVENDEEREALPIVGFCGYFKMVNGMENGKTLDDYIEEYGRL